MTDPTPVERATASDDQSVIHEIGPNPYVGPRPFEPSEAEWFFARDHEARDVVSLIIANQALVLYSQSGAGKTSLINTRVIAGLEARGLHVRPVARVQGRIPAPINDRDVANVFALNTILSLEGRSRPSAALADMPLRKYLDDLLLRENLIPSTANEDEEGRPVVLIFDQFEEFFSFYEHRWNDRERFVRQLVDALNIDDLHIVFAMREDYIANFDTYARLFPNRLRARYRLERLRRPAAIEAIVRPAERAGRSFAEGVAERIVADLLETQAREISGRVVAVEGEFVEAVQLQIVCRSLWESVPVAETVITSDHLRSLATSMRYSAPSMNKRFRKRHRPALPSICGSSGRGGPCRRWPDFARSARPDSD